MKQVFSDSNNNYPILENSSFGAFKLTKIDKYKYSGYGIGFDRRGTFSVPGDGFGQNVYCLFQRKVILVRPVIVEG